MRIDDWILAKNKLLSDKDKMEIMSGDSIMICRFLFEEPTNLAAHAHENEQATLVIEGEMEIEYEGIRRTVKVGEGCIVPSNVVHTVKITKAPFRSYDVFTPIREDFLEVGDK